MSEAPSQNKFHFFSSWPEGVVCAAIVLAMLAYQNTLHNPFVFDDHAEILQNPSIRDITHVRAVLTHQVSRPLVNLTYALDYAWSGLNPFGYHVTNVLLHALNVGLLFAFVRRLFRHLHAPGPALAEPALTWASFTAASLFAVHPLMTEAVGFVSSRSELLVSALLLASLLAFIEVVSGRGGTRWLTAGIVLFVLAGAARESAAVLPVIIFAFDLLRSKQPGESRRLRWRIHLPLIGLCVIFGGWRVWSYWQAENPSSGTQWHTLPTQLDVMRRYISLLFVPTSLSVVQPVRFLTSWLDIRALTGAAVVVPTLLLGLACRKRLPAVTFGIIWFFVVQAPAAVLVHLANMGQPMAEHRVYLASCGVFMVVGAMVGLARNRVSNRHTARIAAPLAIVLGVLFVLTVMRNRVWADPVVLWEDATRKAPTTYMAHYGLGEAYMAIGDCDTAVAAFEQALTIRADTGAYRNMSACLVDSGRPDRARQVLREGIKRVPDALEIRIALAVLEEGARNYAEAQRLCQDVLMRAPADAKAAACVERNRALAAPR